MWNIKREDYLVTRHRVDIVIPSTANRVEASTTNGPMELNILNPNIQCVQNSSNYSLNLIKSTALPGNVVTFLVTLIRVTSHFIYPMVIKISVTETP